MCEFCPTTGGSCSVCGYSKVKIDRIYFQAGRAGGITINARDRESIHQRCGGGVRVIRKKVGSK